MNGLAALLRARSGGTPAIVAGTVLLLAVIWAATVWQVRDERTAAIAAETTKNDNLALAHEERTAHALQAFDQVLRFVRDDYMRHGVPQDLKQRLAAMQVDTRYVHVLSLIAADGHALATTADAPTPNYADRDYFRTHAADPTDRLLVGPPLLGRVTKRWGVTLTRRLSRDDGSFAGVVYLSLDPAYFATLYRKTDTAPRAAMTLIGLDGITRARRNGDRISFGDDISGSQLFKELMHSRQGRFTAVAASDGEMRQASYRQLDDYPLVVVVASSLADVAAAQRGRERALFSAAALASLLLVLLAWALADRLARRGRARRAIEISELRFRLLFENSRDAVLRTTPQGQVLAANPAACRMFGLDEPQLLQIDPRLLVDATDERLLPLARQRAAHGGAAGALTMRRGDGTPFEAEVSSSAYVDGDGRPVASVLIRDVSERRQLENQLQATATELADLYDHAPCGYHSLDAEGRFLRANATLLAWLGCERGELLGRPFTEFLTDEGSALFARQFPVLQAEGHVSGLEFDLRGPEGELRRISISATAVRDVQGRYLMSRSVMFDITPLKQAEAMRVRAVALEAENRQLQEAGRLKSLFLANMSHELRTPLNAIIGLAGLLKSGSVSPGESRFASYLSQIASSGQQLLQAIGNVLDFAQTESKRMQFHPQAIDLPALVDGVVELQRAAAELKRLRLSVVVDDSIGPLQLDPLRLQQVLASYLSNAIKFTPDLGRVLLTVAPHGTDFFRVEVADSGIGVAEADLPRLFTPFMQLSSGTTKAYGGTGLGLALTRRLVEAQGGSVGVDSVPGEGSRFHAVLPRVFLAAA